MSDYRIYHNPRCSKSRQTLAILEEKGIQPEIIRYLEQPPSETELANLLKQLKMSPRQLLRKSEQEYRDHNLKDPQLSDAELIRLMVQYPKLIERPIVVKGQQAILGRPPENVLELL